MKSRKIIMKHTYIHVVPVLSLMLLAVAGSVTAQANDAEGTDVAESSALERDPFWPVDYVPAGTINAKKPGDQEKANVKGPVTNWNEAMKKIAITGISSRGNKFYAVINGEIKSVGETFSLVNGGVTYTWILDTVAPPKTVKLRRVTAN